MCVNIVVHNITEKYTYEHLDVYTGRQIDVKMHIIYITYIYIMLIHTHKTEIYRQIDRYEYECYYIHTYIFIHPHT